MASGRRPEHQAPPEIVRIIVIISLIPVIIQKRFVTFFFFFFEVMYLSFCFQFYNEEESRKYSSK